MYLESILYIIYIHVIFRKILSPKFYLSLFIHCRCSVLSYNTSHICLHHHILMVGLHVIWQCINCKDYLTWDEIIVSFLKPSTSSIQMSYLITCLVVCGYFLTIHCDVITLNWGILQRPKMSAEFHETQELFEGHMYRHQSLLYKAVFVFRNKLEWKFITDMPTSP